MRTSRERLAALLAGLRDGSTTAAQVAEVAVDVLAEPHPLVSAAHRMLAALGSPAEGRAAVDLLSMVTEWADSDDAHAGDGTGRFRGSVNAARELCFRCGSYHGPPSAEG